MIEEFWNSPSYPTNEIVPGAAQHLINYRQHLSTQWIKFMLNMTCFNELHLNSLLKCWQEYYADTDKSSEAQKTSFLSYVTLYCVVYTSSHQ